MNSAEADKTMKEEWYIDSGATTHICNNRSLFNKLEESTYKRVVIANNEQVEIKGTGEVELELEDGSDIKIRNVNYVPSLCTNLLSVCQITKDGKKVKFEKGLCKIESRNGDLLAIATIKNGMYKLNVREQDESAYLVKSEDKIKYQKGEKWHRMLGHPAYSSMNFLKFKDPEINIPEKKCITCIKAKHSRKPFNKAGGERSKKILDLIHTDVCGPMPVQSLGGHKYFITMIDDYSRKCFLYPLKSKSEAFEKFKIFTLMIENQTTRKIKAVRSDNGGEYVNKKFRQFCDERGIIQQTTIPYTPQQNGVAERFNRTIMEKVRSMLIDAGLEKYFWAEAANTAVYLINLMPRKKEKSANEKFNQEKINLGDLRIFGEKCMIQIPKEKRKKLDDKSIECLFMGYEPNGFRVFDPDKNKVVVSRDVIFLNDERENGKIISEEVQAAIVCEEDYEENSSTAENCAIIDQEDISMEVPKTYNEAMTDKNAQKWQEAMKEEYQSLIDNNTWELDDLPDGKKAVKCKWVFATKKDKDGKIIRYKARLVAKGYSQIEGIDYRETFAPVVRYNSIRFLLSYAANMGLKIRQMDAVTAFLNGKLEETVYMEQPPGFKIDNGKSCRLIKSIYGLKQSSRVWNETLNAVLIKFGLARSIFIFISGMGRTIY